MISLHINGEIKKVDVAPDTPLFHNRLFKPILNYHGQNGMRGLLGMYEATSRLLQVDDPFIHRDADTREQLRNLQEDFYRSHEG